MNKETLQSKADRYEQNDKETMRLYREDTSSVERAKEIVKDWFSGLYLKSWLVSTIAKAISDAITEAKQEQFEADVKATCCWCNGDDENVKPQVVDGYIKHLRRDDPKEWHLCHSYWLRHTFPALSEMMDKKESA